MSKLLDWMKEDYTKAEENDFERQPIYLNKWDRFVRELVEIAP